MAIVNRDLDASQQPRVHATVVGALATGITTLVALVPNNCKVVAAAVSAFGLSGSPIYALNVLRPTANGPTLIGLGATLTISTGGLSAVASAFSLTLGATTPLQMSDILMLNSGGTNAAATGVVLTTVLQPLQDVQTFFGSQPS